MTDPPKNSPEPADWRDNLTWYTHQTWLAWLVTRSFKPLLKTITRVECVGFENMPANGPCIVAANHLSNMDVLYMGSMLPRFPHFMAKRELYRNPIFGWVIRQLGSFPVNRGESDAWALAQAGNVLNAGQALFMFPEGTRSGRKAQLKRGKVGVVKLALDYGATVVPAAITGTEDFRMGLTRPTRVRMQCGQPLDVVALAGPPPYSIVTLRDLTTRLMHSIATMLPPEYRGVYGQTKDHGA
jgi:1-acyl-sn-glycerol-3-phosphate acyltransferase